MTERRKEKERKKEGDGDIIYLINEIGQTDTQFRETRWCH